MALEQHRRGRHRHLHERRLGAGAHHRHQPVHRGLALVLEAVENGLARLMNSACFFRRRTTGGRPGDWGAEHEPAIGVGGAQSGLYERLEAGGTGERKPERTPGAVHLKRERGRAGEQTSPPAAQQALVQGLEHRDQSVRGGRVGAVDLNAEAHVYALMSGTQTQEDEESRDDESPGEKDDRQERHNQGYAAERLPPPEGAEHATDYAQQRPDRDGRQARVRPTQHCPQPAGEQPGEQREQDDERRQSEQPPEQKPKHLMVYSDRERESGQVRSKECPRTTARVGEGPRPEHVAARLLAATAAQRVCDVETFSTYGSSPQTGAAACTV